MQAASFWQDWWARAGCMHEDPGFRTVTSRVEGGKVVHVPWAELGPTGGLHAGS